MLEKPDRIFIGGGLASDKGDKIINKSLDCLKQTGIIVANGVTAETESLLIGMYKVYGGELSKYSVSNLKKIGKLSKKKQDIVIFEGWCVGVAPQKNKDLIVPINTLEKEKDKKKF